MLVPLLAILLRADVPKTFEELEIDKLNAYYLLKNYREEMDVSMAGLELHRVTLMNGTQAHVIVKTKDGAKYEALCDGKVGWSINHQQKVYFEGRASFPETFDAKAARVKTGPDSFNFSFNSYQPIQFILDPPLEIKSIETVKVGTETLRKVVASKVKSSGSSLTITQWFLPDKWILRKFALEGQGAGGPIKGSGEATKISFDAKFTPADFTLDPSLVPGYQKQG